MARSDRAALCKMARTSGTCSSALDGDAAPGVRAAAGAKLGLGLGCCWCCAHGRVSNVQQSYAAVICSSHMQQSYAAVMCSSHVLQSCAASEPEQSHSEQSRSSNSSCLLPSHCLSLRCLAAAFSLPFTPKCRPGGRTGFGCCSCCRDGVDPAGMPAMPAACRNPTAPAPAAGAAPPLAAFSRLGTASAAVLAEPAADDLESPQRQRQCLSRAGSGTHKSKQCLSCAGNRNTNQRQCLSHAGSGTHMSKAVS